ncbi:MG2 domain-containing protein [Mucilaginibacter sp. X4EP1]|uniref:MG2 domain-containing protein n=1 Tax=Mucilaginibacter sp. X4EP1 TaxID=2723092 RepID=UPI00216A3194|nr:MG2 domain-containing protein [Mucilaginibacter sp. X4EP1]MCS3813751.1 hypothetical protein [Mucilaginibacter sp. X4EP1]
MFKTAITSLIFVTSICFAAKPQQRIDSTTGRVESKLALYLHKYESEKAYLQFDKPCYAAGDTIYFKAYVTLGERHNLSDLSGVLHVDLINTSNKTDQSIKLELKSGIAWGDFALPDSLPAGHYQVRAYTQWMRNDGNDFYYDKSFAVYAQKAQKTTDGVKSLSTNKNAGPDIQFMPEGGTLIEGVESKIAFKAIDGNGLGIDVNGKITDDAGNEVCVLSSQHLGMGLFSIKLLKGKTYKADVTFANGFHASVSLPSPLAEGICLSVNNDTVSKASVKIVCNNDFYQKNKGNKFETVIYSGGLITRYNFTLDSVAMSFDVLKRHLHTGVATITLFSAENVPLDERLFFVQNYDVLSIKQTGLKDEYHTRDKVAIDLNIKNRADSTVQGCFSATVFNAALLSGQNDSENILSYYLLTADLKGFIEQPAYYFTDISPKKNKELDLVMLTHGYRRFEWQQVLNNNINSPLFEPEKGLEIAGTIKNYFGKPIANGTVSLIAASGGPVLSAVSDDKGSFKFDNLNFTDTARFVLSAVKANGKNSTVITSTPATEGQLFKGSTILPNQVNPPAIDSLNDKEDLLRNEVLNGISYKGKLLKEVQIIAKKKNDDDYETLSVAGAGHADQVMRADQIAEIQGTLITSLNGRLRGVTFLGFGTRVKAYLTTNLNSPNGASPMLVVVDGAEVPSESINSFTSNDIETIEVLKYGSAAAYGMNGGKGVLVITSKQGGGKSAKDITATSVLPITPIGFYKARQFYSPKYDHPASQGTKQDLRSTIYWDPNITTTANGNASFEYYNSDAKGAYVIIIEGIDEQGNLGRQVFRYTIK